MILIINLFASIDYLMCLPIFHKYVERLTDSPVDSMITLFSAQLKKGITKSSVNMTDLPDECLRMIFACFSDHRDICRVAKVNRYVTPFAPGFIFS